MKKLLTLALILSSAGLIKAEVQELGSMDELVSFLGKNQPKLIEFYTDWCQPCKDAYSDFVALSNSARYENIAFAKINFEKVKGASNKIAPGLKIDGVPTFIILDKDNNIKHQVVSAIWRKIEAELSKVAQ